jgi:azurin
MQWNLMEVPVPYANGFWLGWSDGCSRRVSSADPLRIHNAGAKFNREAYEFGLTLGESGVNARDAMAHFSLVCKNMAMSYEDAQKWRRE